MKIIIFAIALSLPLLVSAGTQLDYQKIIYISNGWSGTHLYITTDQKLSAEDCHATDKRIVLEDSHPQFELLSSMLLSAIHANSNVKFYVDGCGSNNLMKLMAVGVEGA